MSESTDWSQFRLPSALIYLGCILGVLVCGGMTLSLGQASGKELFSAIIFLFLIGFMLAGPLILAEQFLFAGRDKKLSFGEWVWILYPLFYGMGIPLTLIALIALPRSALLVLYLMGFSAFLWPIIALIGLMLCLLDRSPLPLRWSSYTGCLAILGLTGSLLF